MSMTSSENSELSQVASSVAYYRPTTRLISYYRPIAYSNNPMSETQFKKKLSLLV